MSRSVWRATRSFVKTLNEITGSFVKVLIETTSSALSSVQAGRRMQIDRFLVPQLRGRFAYAVPPVRS